MAHFRTYDYKNEYKEGIIELEIKLELKEETIPVEDIIIAVNLTELENPRLNGCFWLITCHAVEMWDRWPFNALALSFNIDINSNIKKSLIFVLSLHVFSLPILMAMTLNQKSCWY